MRKRETRKAMTRCADCGEERCGKDETIEEIKRLDALLEYAVMHGDEAEAERIRAELKRLIESV